MSDIDVAVPTIKPRENGSLRVSGGVRLIDADGNDYTPEGDFSLCRCGHSKNKPFCDGSHKAFEFTASSANVPEETPET